MEEAQEIIITKDDAFHLLKHFQSIDKISRNLFLANGFKNEEINKSLSTAGSKFFSNFCNNPFELLHKLKYITPVTIMSNEEKRILFYLFPDKHFIGLDNLIALDELSDAEKLTLRETLISGHSVKIVNKAEFIETNRLYLVVSVKDNCLITAFPGRYAPAFPNSLKDKNDIKESINFWDNHAFIARNHS